MTPIQEAIVEIAKSSDGGKTQAYAEAIVILRRLLPKEREFVNRVWNAGATSGYDNKRVHGTCEWDKESHAANFIDFINQLYPEK